MFGSYSNGGLGFGLAFTLQDFFTRTGEKIRREMGSLEDRSSKMVENVNREFSRLASGTKMLLVGGAIVAGLGGAINKSMEFNAAMSSVQAKSRATETELQGLKTKAIELGNATKFTALEAAQGMDFLAMAGFRVQDIMSSMPGMLSLAASGNIDLARAADIASNVLTQFTLKADEMGRVADVMANSVVTSNINMEQLADSLKYLGPTANALNVSIEETIAQIMALGNAGLQGSLATRALGTSVANLTKPTRQMQDAIDALGISFFDQQGRFVGFNKMIGILENALAGMSDKQRLFYITTLFGAESIQEINTLLNAQTEVMENGTKKTLKGAAALEEFTRQNQNAAGAADRMANQMLDNLKGDIIIFQSVWETTMIKIGDALEPLLRPLVKGFTAIVTKIGEFIETPLGKFLVRIVAGLGAILSIMGALKVGLAVARLAMMAFGAATWTALAPLLPVIAIIAAVVAAIGGIIYVVNKAKDAFATMEAKGTGFVLLLQKLGGFIATVKEVWQSWDRVNQTFALTPDLEKKLDMLGIKDTALAIGTWVVRIKEFFLSIKDGFNDGIAIVREVKAAMQPAFDTINGWLDKINLSIGKNTTSLDTFKTIGKAVGYIIAFWFGVIAVTIEAVKVGVYLLVTAFTWLFTKLVEGFTKAWQLVGDFFTFIISLPGMIYDAGKNFIMSFWDGMKSIAGNMVQWLKDTIMSIPGMELALKGVKMIGGALSGTPEEPAGRVGFGGGGAGGGWDIGGNEALFQGNTARPQVTVNTPASKQQPLPPLVIHNTIEVDGEKMARKVNEVNEFNSSRQ